MNDILGGVKSCASCSGRTRMMALPKAQREAGALHASLAAAARSGERVSEYIIRFGPIWCAMRAKMQCARRRCEDTNNKSFHYYGGRGIKFVFASDAAGALWVLENIGAAPPGTSLDRIDNNRHYEPGNLRWATPSEQNSNKRAYMRTTRGEKVRGLALLRPDLTEETIRTWIKKGYTDDEITNRRKHVGCGVRHS